MLPVTLSKGAGAEPVRREVAILSMPVPPEGRVDILPIDTVVTADWPALMSFCSLLEGISKLPEEERLEENPPKAPEIVSNSASVSSISPTGLTGNMASSSVDRL